MERTNTGLASAVAVLLALLPVLNSCASNSDDLYARNRNGKDPRAVPLTTRNPGSVGVSSDTIVTEFKSLQRPIILRYQCYTPTTRQSMQGEATYTHIILTDGACAFVRRYTWDEMVVALAPLLKDPYWSGDVVATLATASNPFQAGRILSVEKYRSPDDQGAWAKYGKQNVRNWGASMWHPGTGGPRWGILNGELYDYSKYELEHPLPTRPGAPRD